MNAQPMAAAKAAPGPKGPPLLGIISTLRRDPLAFVMSVARTYGDVVGYKIGPMQSHLIAHPDGIRQVLQDNVKNYTKDHFSYSIVRWIAGNGLLTSQGDFWLRQRRLSQPAFHRQRIAAMGASMVKATQELVAGWEQPVAQGKQIDISQEMMKLTLRIVSEALFGTAVKQAEIVDYAFSEINVQVVERFRHLNVIPPVLPTPYDRRFRGSRAQLDAIVYEIIAERRQNQDDRGDLLSMLMLARDEDTGETMSDSQLRDEVMTMMLAGHETTATTLSWAFALLSDHPEAAAKLYAEVDALEGRTITIEDLPKLPYSRMIVDETLRLRPAVYLMSRKVVADDVIGGYRIPAGTSVDLAPYVTHRHPALWDKPDDFMPERFSPDQAAARPRFAYFPFSGGPRQCIGNSFALMEAQLILSTIAQHYRLELPPGHQVIPDPLITLRPRGGLPMLVVPRV